jgi:endonuclease/exonuclease/phosphatase family metal-dependent hydrolase
MEKKPYRGVFISRHTCKLEHWMMILFLPFFFGFSSELQAAEEKELVLVTYNIHHAEGTDGKLSLERIAEDIKHADIAALQEVDRNFGARSEFADQAERLAELLNMYYVFAANLDLDGSTSESGRILNQRRQYGTAILSRYPIEYSRNYPLPKMNYVNSASEQRGLLEAQVSISGKKLRIYCTHLSHLSNEQRILQANELKKNIGQAETTGTPQGNEAIASSFILMGDFNCRPDSEPYEIITGEFRRGIQLIRVDGVVDFWPLVNQSEGNTIGIRGSQASRIDYIFISPDLAKYAHSAWVDNETLASDHQPVTAVLKGF